MMMDFPIISPQEAYEIVISSVYPLKPIPMPITEVCGLVLAERIIADEDIPAFINSAMDGFAVRAEDTRIASVEHPVKLQILCDLKAGGFPSRAIGKNEAVRIMTGAPIPEGADAVCPVEDTFTEGNSVSIKKSVKKGENIRPAGEDLHQGELVLEKGEVLNPAGIGILASLNRSSVLVYPRPKIAIIATGDELIDIGEPIVKGQIRNSNSYTMMAMALEVGAIPINFGIVRDDPKKIEEKIKEGLKYDILITTGGVSVGEYDLVKEVLINLGIEMKFWRVSQKPGKPMAFGILKHKPVFGLPGNPAACMVCFEEYVRPAIRKMMGYKRLKRQTVEVILDESIKKPSDRLHFVRATVFNHRGILRAKVTGPQGSGRLQSMLKANALLLIPADKTFQQGDKVYARLIDQPEVD